MKSILDNRPALHAAVWQVAETAGYLWEKGWAERNGGNITVNITVKVQTCNIIVKMFLSSFYVFF